MERRKLRSTRRQNLTKDLRSYPSGEERGRKRVSSFYMRGKKLVKWQDCLPAGSKTEFARTIVA